MTKNHQIQQQIECYLLTQSRNKIVLHSAEIEDITPIDVGMILSESISSSTENSRLALKAKAIIDDILTSSIFSHKVYGKIIALTNIGILMEPELKIDITSLLDKFSRDMTLFLLWKGEIIDGSLFFLTKENGIEINIKKLSYIAI